MEKNNRISYFHIHKKTKSYAEIRCAAAKEDKEVNIY